MMKMLKEEGIQNVTAEVCPHHFILTSDDIERDDPNYKMIRLFVPERMWMP